jgi:hypothetical protein
MLLMGLSACARPSDVERVSRLPEASLLYPGAEWTTPLRVHEGVPVASASVGRRFVTPDDWPAVLAYYSSQLHDWQGPVPAVRLSPDLDAKAWEKNGTSLTLSQTRPVPTDLETGLGPAVSVYAVTIAVKKGG